jgi:hypothetical protein
MEGSVQMYLSESYLKMLVLKGSFKVLLLLAMFQ